MEGQCSDGWGSPGGRAAGSTPKASKQSRRIRLVQALGKRRPGFQGLTREGAALILQILSRTSSSVLQAGIWHLRSSCTLDMQPRPCPRTKEQPGEGPRQSLSLGVYPSCWCTWRQKPAGAKPSSVALATRQASSEIPLHYVPSGGVSTRFESCWVPSGHSRTLLHPDPRPMWNQSS